MTPWVELARADTADGDQLILRRRGACFEIRCNGWELMSNRSHHSEEVLARLGCARVPTTAPSVLIGGLGMGYTLRAALDVLPGTSRVVVAEALADIIAWNRGLLAHLAGDPLMDARVAVMCGDVADRLGAQCNGFDAILLDVDNGPAALSLRRNRRLYTAVGVASMVRALRPAGVLAVWSADRSAQFETTLDGAGLRWHAVNVPARGIPDDPAHTIYIAERLRS